MCVSLGPVFSFRICVYVHTYIHLDAYANWHECMYVYVCMCARASVCVCMCVCMHVRVYVSLYLRCLHVCVCVWKYTCRFVCAHVSERTCLYLYLIYASVCICTQGNVSLVLFLYTYTCMHLLVRMSVCMHACGELGSYEQYRQGDKGRDGQTEGAREGGVCRAFVYRNSECDAITSVFSKRNNLSAYTHLY